MNENSLNNKLTTIENSVAEMRVKLNLNESASLEQIIEETTVVPYPFKTHMAFTYIRGVDNVQAEINGIDFINWQYLSGIFAHCSDVKYIDFSKSNCQNIRSINSAFTGCSSLEFLDLRTFNLPRVNDSGYALDSVPTTCLIVVKDDEAKTWWLTKFAKYTNVKTVAEYEGEQSNE